MVLSSIQADLVSGLERMGFGIEWRDYWSADSLRNSIQASLLNSRTGKCVLLIAVELEWKDLNVGVVDILKRFKEKAEEVMRGPD